MPRLDFEKQFARQLQDRELQPSADSWEKLQGRLEREEGSSSPKFWWIGIAATLVGAIVLFNFFGNDAELGTPEIADTEGEEIYFCVDTLETPSTILAVEETDELAETDASPGVETLQNKNEGTHKSSKIAEVNQTQNTPIIEEQENNARAHPASGFSKVEEEAVVAAPENSEEYLRGDSEIDALLAQAMAEVARETGEVPEVTDAQINRLLKEARRAVRNEKALHQTASVSADQLLWEVETELEQSFRREVFEIIKEGIRKTRSAVANIND